MWSGKGTMPGHGTCPGTWHRQLLLHDTPKFAGLSFFSRATASLINVSFDFPTTFIRWSSISSLDLLSMSISIVLLSSAKYIRTVQFSSEPQGCVVDLWLQQLQSIFLLSRKIEKCFKAIVAASLSKTTVTQYLLQILSVKCQ